MIRLLTWLRNWLTVVIDRLDGVPNPFTVTTYQVRVLNELRQVRKQAERAEKLLVALKAASDRIIADAAAVPNGEMTPFVLKTVVEIENAMYQAKKV